MLGARAYVPSLSAAADYIGRQAGRLLSQLWATAGQTRTFDNAARTVDNSTDHETAEPDQP